MLSQTSTKKLNQLKTWLTSQQAVTPNRKKSTGRRVLFYGLSPDDKAQAVESLRQEFNGEIYKVDLSKVVSKYIGETEKNLSRVFKEAESKNAILFFDEADALFGKRTEVRDGHDKYANQEVSYLLQRAENFEGLVIVASNSKKNIDPAFLRRFQTVVHFPPPKPPR